MKKFMVVLAVLGLFASPAFGDAMLILEGPDDREEGFLPPGLGKVKIDVYAEGVGDFAGVETALTFFSLETMELSDDFQISKTDGNSAFGDLAIWPNEAKFPSAFPIYIPDSGHPRHRQMGGFMLMTGGADLTEKTLLQSVWYDYTVDAWGGYLVSANLGETVISDSFALPVDYTAISGHFSIVPEPASIALLGTGLIALLGFLIRSRKKIPKG